MTARRKARLLGIGTATPDGRMDQREAAEMVAAIGSVSPSRARAMAQLFERTGIESRPMAIIEGRTQRFYNGTVPDTEHRMREYQDRAPALAHKACERALERADAKADRVTHLVTASCTGFASPGVDIALMRSLGLSAETERIHIGFMGCHAALNALRTARAIALAEPEARVLVCCVELCSLHMQASQARGCAVADALFADGAAACVVAQSAHTEAPGLQRTASVLLPDSLQDMGWTIGQGGFTMTLSPRVPDVLASNVRPWVESLLAEEGLAIDDVPSWAIHPGGPRVLQSVAHAIGIAERATEASSDILKSHGNMSSATVLFILQRLLDGEDAMPAVAMAFGPGLTGEALLLA
ncbi:MAG: type III polyketide synthase [Phycisphaerales bacterium]